MSSFTAMPVPFSQPAPITQETIKTLGLKSSYVTSTNGHATMVILPEDEAVPVPFEYERALRVLSYRFELQKYTIPKVAASRRTCKMLLNSLLYLDRVRDRFAIEVRAVPTAGALRNWRCAAFDYHIWLDYMYAQHDEEARRLLHSEHGITFERVASKQPGTDIFKTLDWATFKLRHCREVDFCGFDYPLEKVIGTQPPPAAELWAKSILSRELNDESSKYKDDSEGMLVKNSKRKMTALVEDEGVIREQHPGQLDVRADNAPFLIAMENLRNLLREDVPSIESDISSVEQRDELLGVRLFKDALENYTENPRLLEEFFRLSGTASRLLKDIHQAQKLSHPMQPGHNAEDADNAQQPCPSKALQVPLTVTVRRGRDSNPTNSTRTASIAPKPSPVQPFSNEDLFKAWKKHRKP